MRALFARPDIAKEMDIRGGVGDDIRQSRRFKSKVKILNLLDRDTAFLFSTDGVSPYKDLSSKTSWWPMTLSVTSFQQRLNISGNCILIRTSSTDHCVRKYYSQHQVLLTAT
jgi:hypothetical protein